MALWCYRRYLGQLGRACIVYYNFVRKSKETPQPRGVGPSLRYYSRSESNGFIGETNRGRVRVSGIGYVGIGHGCFNLFLKGQISFWPMSVMRLKLQGKVVVIQ